MAGSFIHPTADFAKSAQIGKNSKVWSNSQICEKAFIGDDVTIGSNVYVGPGTHIGNNCKIQNNALIYEPAILEDGVFIGPAVILTNDKFPRAINPDGSSKLKSDWDPVSVTIKKGASIGARVVCVAPIEIGEWALVAAGSTVTSDIPNYALVAGAPARKIAWVGKAGYPLEDVGNRKFLCPKSGDFYEELSDGTLVEFRGNIS